MVSELKEMGNDFEIEETRSKTPTKEREETALLI